MKPSRDIHLFTTTLPLISQPPSLGRHRRLRRSRRTESAASYVSRDAGRSSGDSQNIRISAAGRVRTPGGGIVAVRFTPKFETSVLLLAVSVRSDRSWLDLSLLRISDLIQILEDAMGDFPDQDRRFVELYLADVCKVVELRNPILHGRPDHEHPALMMPMNPAIVARAWRLTRNVTRYLNKNLERSEQHFGSNSDPDPHTGVDG
jgi:hypothetical protein